MKCHSCQKDIQIQHTIVIRNNKQIQVCSICYKKYHPRQLKLLDQIQLQFNEIYKPIDINFSYCDSCFLFEDWTVRCSLFCHHYLCLSCIAELAETHQNNAYCKVNNCKALIDQPTLLFYCKVDKPHPFLRKVQCPKKCHAQQYYVKQNADVNSLQSPTVRQTGPTSIQCTICLTDICLNCNESHPFSDHCNYELLFQLYCLNKKVKQCPRCTQHLEMTGCDTAYVVCGLCEHQFCQICYNPKTILSEDQCYYCKKKQHSFPVVAKKRAIQVMAGTAIVCWLSIIANTWYLFAKYMLINLRETLIHAWRFSDQCNGIFMRLITLLVITLPIYLLRLPGCLFYGYRNSYKLYLSQLRRIIRY